MPAHVAHFIHGIAAAMISVFFGLLVLALFFNPGLVFSERNTVAAIGGALAVASVSTLPNSRVGTASFGCISGAIITVLVACSPIIFAWLTAPFGL